jgi:hypothetical protein
MGATQWTRSVKRVCALGCVAGGVSIFSASCAPAPIPPRGFVAAALEEGATESCALTGSIVAIGTNETTVPTNMNGITVSCTVSASGSGFAVTANVSNGTSNFTIEGTLSNADAATNQPGITASFAGNTVTYDGANCTVNFTPLLTQPDAVQSNGQTLMGVAKGRVWGNLTCPTMNQSGGQTSVCQGTAEFKFEDCSD